MPVVCPFACIPSLVGQPNKFKHLKRAFEYIAKHDDVWLTTGDEVNDWYRQEYM